MNNYTFECPNCKKFHQFRDVRKLAAGEFIFCEPGCGDDFEVKAVKYSFIGILSDEDYYILTLQPSAIKPGTSVNVKKGTNGFVCPRCRRYSTTTIQKVGETTTCASCKQKVETTAVKTHVEYDVFEVKKSVKSEETTTAQPQEETPHKFKFRCLWCQDDRYIDEAKIGDKVTCSICSKESKLTGIKLTRFSAVKIDLKSELPYKALCHKCFNLSDIDLVVGKNLAHGSTICCPKCKAAHKVEEFVTLQSHIGVILSPAPEKQGVSDVIEEMKEIAKESAFFKELLKMK